MRKMEIPKKVESTHCMFCLCQYCFDSFIKNHDHVKGNYRFGSAFDKFKKGDVRGARWGFEFVLEYMIENNLCCTPVVQTIIQECKKVECQHCGGKIGGLFSSKCKSCGKT